MKKAHIERLRNNNHITPASARSVIAVKVERRAIAQRGKIQIIRKVVRTTLIVCERRYHSKTKIQQNFCFLCE